METISQTFDSIKNTVTSAFSSSTTSPVELSRSDVNKLEEHERTRRLEQVVQTRVDKQNAANVSSLIRTQSFPVFRGNVSKGYKRVTTRFEEDERRRRLTNKSESALRRANANKTARMIQRIGWPLYQGTRTGAEYITMDSTKMLEEEEREWRMSDSYWGPTAKHNAAMVANILRWGNFQKNPRAGFKRHVRYLEEKERLDRLCHDVLATNTENAYNESRLISNLGLPFYVQEPLERRDFSVAHKLEENERKHRIKFPEEQQLATELANVVPGQWNLDNELEEQERGRRMTDHASQKLAQQNAKHVSLMVRESSSNKINGTAPMWFSISRNSMRALEEIERTRRLRDIEGQLLAKEHSRLISEIILRRWSESPKRNLNAIEEEERQSRILDRAQQQLAVKNARKVSGLIAKHNLLSSGSRSFALALEESERSRRLQDSDGQQTLARNNAKKVSNLINSLNVAPGRHVAQDTPLSPANLASIPPTQSLPTYNAPVSAAPTTVNIPTATLQKAFVATAPLEKTTVFTAPTALPATSQRSSGEFLRSESPLVAAAPVIRSAPLATTTIAPAPIALASAAPILPSAAPIAPVAAPISAPVLPVAAPVAASIAPVASSYTPLSRSGSFSPSTTPLSNSGSLSRSGSYINPSTLTSSPSIQPIVLATTSAPVPVAPLASVSSMPVRQTSFNNPAPAFTTPTVPVDIIAISHPALGERQRKKLLKQVDRHNRKSEKDVRKAEQSMLKAEKLHQKGRDDKASKLEQKADLLMKTAENERRWASGIQGELAPNAPAPASM